MQCEKPHSSAGREICKGVDERSDLEKLHVRMCTYQLSGSPARPGTGHPANEGTAEHHSDQLDTTDICTAVCMFIVTAS